MKGILLAGGTGTRLFPLTNIISKHLLPIYNKPLIYYSLSVLMLSGIREILIITNPEYLDDYKKLLGDGELLGVHIQYSTQSKPNGIAESIIIGSEFIGKSSFVLILGDNIFYGEGLPYRMKKLIKSNKGCTIFGYKVKDPTRFGVIEFDDELKVKSLIEKPRNPKSNYAATGLYIFDNKAINIANNIKPSKRNELEITSVIKNYIEEDNINLEIFGRGMTWFDAGTYESLLEAGEFIKTFENRQGFKIACLEEISFKNAWIDSNKLEKIIKKIPNIEYKNYLRKIIDE